jgi:hypothetical protein
MFENEEEFEQYADSLRFDDAPNPAHRDALERQLLGELRKERKMSILSFIRATPRRTTAAAALVAAILIASGWGAAQVYQAVIKGHVSYHVDTGKPETRTLTLPSGKNVEISQSEGISTGSNDPQFTEEKAREQFESMKNAISAGKYEFVKTYQLPGGETTYIYLLTFADGTKGTAAFAMPLEGVKSWEDYQAKAKENRDRRFEQIRQAVAKGSFRLINVEPIVVHVCRDPNSGAEYHVLQSVHPDGAKFAMVFSGPIVNAKQSQETTWDEHLQAIANGSRTLVDLIITNNYFYEVTLADGSTTIYSFGGKEPLDQEGK